jgi:hypothetical protein
MAHWMPIRNCLIKSNQYISRKIKTVMSIANSTTNLICYTYYTVIVYKLNTIQLQHWNKKSETTIIPQSYIVCVESQGTKYTFHVGQVSALCKINNTDSPGWDYRICSHWASFYLGQVLLYMKLTTHKKTEHKQRNNKKNKIKHHKKTNRNETKIDNNGRDHQE